MRTRSLAAAIAVALVSVGGAHAATPTIRASVAPASANVGDVVVYTVTVTFASTDDARDARVEAPPGPLEIVGTERLDRDGATVRLTQRLACLGSACVPFDGPREVRLPPARAHGGAATVIASPVAVTMVPLVPAAAVRAEETPWRRQTAIPAAETRAPFGATTAALAVAAIALAVASVLLVAGEIRRNRRSSVAGGDELERALRLVRESAAREAPDRRRAAGLLSRVTRRRGAREAAAGADRAAWSRPEPTPADARALADATERASR